MARFSGSHCNQRQCPERDSASHIMLNTGVQRFRESERTNAFILCTAYPTLAYFNSDRLLIPYRGLHCCDRNRGLDNRINDRVLLLKCTESRLSHSDRYHSDELLRGCAGISYRQNLQRDDRSRHNL